MTVCHMALVTRFTDELQDSLSNDLPVPPNVVSGDVTGFPLSCAAKSMFPPWC